MTNTDYYKLSFEERYSLRRINNLLEEENLENKIDGARFAHDFFEYERHTKLGVSFLMNTLISNLVKNNNSDELNSEIIRALEVGIWEQPDKNEININAYISFLKRNDVSEMTIAQGIMLLTSSNYKEKFELFQYYINHKSSLIRNAVEKGLNYSNL
ncbi:hypothetical protein Fleli_3695 [Bernardetia litoralis DSM 6794]|uniref:Uncharacterized protein n=1 Tax=Bernardetia litoralis (strain ATCC 23117 / DSM 6794 / NBRC 15988 / NCIMB 1366 / Fx l1 / Sio-4) TaxID=880071 RepID=I4APX3_BERLS|nr:hypothetical protein [Bernardetia litoralis]AFM06008.1 hypothetical protein Fleli_3695 [Bernardetia litoralis DSM 6794]